MGAPVANITLKTPLLSTYEQHCRHPAEGTGNR
jgi:hypothetical protein